MDVFQSARNNNSSFSTAKGREVHLIIHLNRKELIREVR